MRLRKSKAVTGSETSGIIPVLRPQVLTQELLDWGLAALEAIISTPELQALAQSRTKQSVIDAYKQLDRLYPLTREVQRQAILAELEARDTGVARVPHQLPEARRERVVVVRSDGPLEASAEDGGGHRSDGVPEVWEED